MLKINWNWRCCARILTNNIPTTTPVGGIKYESKVPFIENEARVGRDRGGHLDVDDNNRRRRRTVQASPCVIYARVVFVCASECMVVTYGVVCVCKWTLMGYTSGYTHTLTPELFIWTHKDLALTVISLWLSLYLCLSVYSTLSL